MLIVFLESISGYDSHLPQLGWSATSVIFLTEGRHIWFKRAYNRQIEES